MTPLSDATLYGIIDLGYVTADEAPDAARELLAGGVGVLQLRAKRAERALIRDLAGEIAPLCRGVQVPFVLNDHPELVEETGADGVHVGQDDVSVARAREIVGANRIVGLSTHSLDQVRAAIECVPDYIGFGPLFSTATKPDYLPIGLADVAEANRIAPFPVFCIGGIKRENLPQILEAGARRVVIVSGLLEARDRTAYARECRILLNPRKPKSATATTSNPVGAGSGITARMRL
ncbi:MAG: thiamine phosphate synthase [Terrimicrobiaceae bacterium]|nr:thiamine phosphate synthase [Terrimicrobiaceae bacterium]